MKTKTFSLVLVAIIVILTPQFSKADNCPGTCRQSPDANTPACFSNEKDAGSQYDSSCPDFTYTCCVSSDSSSKTDNNSSSEKCVQCKNECQSASTPEAPLNCEGYCASECKSEASTSPTGNPGGTSTGNSSSNNSPTGNTSITNPPTGNPSTGAKCSGKFTEFAGVCFPVGTGLSETPLEDIIMNFMMWLLGIFGFIAIIGFCISGIQYLTSAGDEKGIETAKRNMKWSIIGVIVALAGFVIIKAVDAALKASTLF